MQSIQSSGENSQMTSAVTWARSLERTERNRLGSVPQARRALARKLRVSVGTVENLIRDRVKRVDAAIRDRLQALVIRELEQEIARLQHELEMARQGGDHPASQHIGAIETHLAQAKALMRGEAL